MDKSKTSFATQKVIYDGVLVGYGVVLDTDGTIREPDMEIPAFLDGIPSKNEWTQIWNEVKEDELALTVKGRYGRLDFAVVYRPKNPPTKAQINMAKQLENEARNANANWIDWADDECWKFDPTRGFGWHLEPLTNPSKEELETQVKAANRRLANLPDQKGECPHAFLSLRDPNRPNSQKYLNVCNSRSEQINECLLSEKLNEWSVQCFLQLERDYTCHTLVMEKRRQQAQYVEEYEKFRSGIEEQGGHLVNVGVDGFCLMLEGVVPKVYGLHEDDFVLFIEDLSQVLDL